MNILKKYNSIFHLTLEEYHPSLNSDDANKKISSLIKGGVPFMVGRFGSVEFDVLSIYALKIKSNYVNSLYNSLVRKKLPWWTKSIKDRMRINAGFFPVTDSSLAKFSELMLNLCAEVNLLGSWIPGEPILNKYLERSDICKLRDIEPYYHEQPWSAALENRKVLVIHPFADTISSQYKKRKLLFENQAILPNFKLETLTAVQSIAGNNVGYDDWFEALDSMYLKALLIDFEVAIIGCGAYGFALSAMLKKSGKKVIHLGGATQILFGIKGSRWDSHPYISRLYNEHWVRPSEEERPKNSIKVENSCYW